jgi:energy-coupling factor transport system ATP-binding protein
MGADALRFEDVHFTYRRGSRPALDGLSATLKAGECLWLLGRSGSGRSTLALTTNRIVPLHHRGELRGRIELFGLPVEGCTTAGLARTVGQVFQDFESQIFGSRVDLEVAFGCENLGITRREMHQRVSTALEQVGLAGFESRNPAHLSGGEKQRLALAGALAMRPKLLVLDEPTTDLDPLGRHSVWDLVRELRDQGTSLLLIEPETEEADLGERVGVLAAGRMVAEGPAPEILSRTSELDDAGVRPPDLSVLSERLGLPGPLSEIDEIERAIRAAGLVGGARDRSSGERPGGSHGPGPGAEVIRLQGVRHSYPGGGEVLRGVDLEFREG